MEKMISEDVCLAQVHDILAGETPNLRDLLFRDPDSFQSGHLRTRIGLWKKNLDEYEPTKDVLEWLGHGMDVKKFIKPFRGSLRVSGMRARNPRLDFLRTTTLADSFRETILQRIESGAIRVWGKVGEVAPPHLALPMTIEPQRPRLCIDARF